MGLIPNGVIFGLGGIFMAGLWLGSILWRDSGAKKQLETIWAEALHAVRKRIKFNENSKINIYSSLALEVGIIVALIVSHQMKKTLSSSKS
ncbi:hypothetical protein [Desulforhabdus sp. TSK]|uniref:hypothetical protein n=1 Tax=Desulforhabdus sp. TSK TaxID=2925014 RepID=UPI001FC7E70A|nr:hypothetical protein [Desulforhabdus sp. TSK]